jgi:8-hydroxy-5-deazaflavin:NADPH oxidoreductase
MAHLTVIGTGTMGQAITGLATRGGHTVQTLGATDTAHAVTGEIVVLAVPAAALSTILATRGPSLAGKIVVDITNPVDFATFDSLVVPADSSAAAELAEALPQSRVLKAFNTTFAATLASGTVAVDAGSLRRARELEALGFLQITLAIADRISWTGGFALNT